MTTSTAWPVPATELLEALSLRPYSERRTKLRHFASTALRHVWGSKPDWSMFNAPASLIGDGTNQIKAMNIKALVNNLHETALANVALNRASADRMVLAIVNPAVCGVESGRSKTGYLFGVHEAHHDPGAIRCSLERGIKHVIEASAKEPEPHTETKASTMKDILTDTVMEELEIKRGAAAEWLPDMPLRKIVTAICHVIAASGATLEDAIDTLALIFPDHERADGVFEYLRAIDPESLTCPDSPLDDGIRCVIEALLDHIECRTRAAGAGASGADAGASGAGAGASGGSRELLAIPLEKKKVALIDMALDHGGLPKIADLIGAINEARGEAHRLAEELDRTRAAKASEPMPVIADPTAGASGDVPEGKITMKLAADVFGLKGLRRGAANFEVPVFEWEGVHPHVPVVDDEYIFRPYELMGLLIGLIHNEPTYLAGHTGTGKTTMIEQVAARLGWPVFRLNFDSEITRMDLIGRDVLTQEDGASVSRFEDGVIPRYMCQPYVMIYDEFDFVRPDVAYVMQRVLENDRLVITEDGGRVVRPHPMARIMATGNTKGQGDEHGLYQGARPQSMALLDRFTNWIEVDYLEPADRLTLIAKAAPGLSAPDRQIVCQYVTEHLQAFKDAKVLQPLTPRGFMTLAQRLEFMLTALPKTMRGKAMEQAWESTVLARASVQDAVVLKGIYNRVVA